MDRMVTALDIVFPVLFVLGENTIGTEGTRQKKMEKWRRWVVEMEIVTLGKLERIWVRWRPVA